MISKSIEEKICVFFQRRKSIDGWFFEIDFDKWITFTKQIFLFQFFSFNNGHLNFSHLNTNFFFTSISIFTSKRTNSIANTFVYLDDVYHITRRISLEKNDRTTNDTSIASPNLITFNRTQTHSQNIPLFISTNDFRILLFVVSHWIQFTFHAEISFSVRF